MGSDFNPNSTDSMFAKILANQERDREERAEFRAEMRGTLAEHGKRLKVLETFKTALKSKVAIISGGVTVFGGLALDWVRANFFSGNGAP